MRIPEALYQQFCRAMPLACVDLILVDRSRRALPYLRESHPARGRWWSPGAASCTRDTAAGSAPEAARDVRHPRERRRGHDFRCAECRLRLEYSRPLAAGAPARLRPGGTLAVGSEPGMSVEAPSKRNWNP